MSAQLFFTFTYLPFVIFSAMSCMLEERKSKILKILSVITLALASVSYIFFIKDIL